MSLEIAIVINISAVVWQVRIDHDEPPDGEGEGEPDGHRVDHQGEVGVEQHEDAPPKGILKFRFNSIV